MEGLAGAASIVALVQITEEIGKLCGNYIQGVRHAKRDIERLQSKASALHGVLTRLNDKPQANIDSKAVQNCCEELKSIKERLEPRKKHATMQRMGLRALKWPFTSKEIEDRVQALEKYLVLFNTTLQLDVLDKVSDAEQDRLLEKLAYAGDALFNSYENEQRHRMCLENTRVEVLQQAMEWTADDSSRCIFWLKGLAGTGKSTIANTVAFRLKAGTRPVATFFFKRGHGDLAHVRKLIPTVARQLSAYSPLYRQAIVTVIKKEPDLGHSANFREQYEKLLVEPLRGLIHSTHDHIQFYIIMDALDECEEERDLRMLLKLMATTDDLPQLGLKILVTSRPELSIRHGFEEIPSIFHRNLALQDVPRSVVDKDIRTYLSHELKDVQREFDLPADWPVDQDLDTLASKAGGLFIFAATACRYVGGSPQAKPDDRLKQICNTIVPNNLMTEELDQMYTTILQNSTKGSSLLMIADMTNLQEAPLAHDFIQDCHRFTMAFRRPIEQAPEQVYVSALVFSPSKSIVRQNFNHEMPQWIRLAMTLPEGWGRSLQTIYCRYPIDTITFLHHGKLLATSGHYFDRDEHYCQGLEIWDQGTGDCQSTSLPIGDMVVNSLSPDGSLVVSVSLEEVLTIWDVAKRENRFAWGRRPSPITATAFLFDSRLLALGYKDGSVRILKTQTGTDHWNLKDHSNEIVGLAFSPDATMIAISARDEMIRLYDVQSGSHHSTIGDRACDSLGKFDTYVTVFSPDSKSIVISFDNGIVQLWDTTTSKCRFNLEGHSKAVRQARYSPNGELLATRSDDGDVSIWDLQTGTCLSILVGGGMDFSADGNLLALGSSSKVQVWDIQKRTESACLDGHSWNVLAVCFSPDGSFLASGSRDQTVRVWKMDSMPVDDHSANSRSEPASEGNYGAICRVEFSPDGKFVASGSDAAVRIWQSETGDCYFEYEGYSPSFSSNGLMVISTSEDGLRLFDVKARNSYCSPTRCSAHLPILSPDGRLVASALDDNSI
ncbi:MAG: hypothetical protein L6R38_006240 [Xanthoria sp. 2 TBL-2021]|nr:MAG: hypothetical protein L6R38_006240 [Xanthoria sp. 2 TBL-2021]